MNKIVIALAVIFLSGCNLAYEMQDDYTYNLIGDGSEIYYSSDFDVLDSNRKICNYLFDNLTFKNIKKYDDVEFVLERGFGNCKDYARIYINIVYVTTGVKLNMIGVDMDTRSIVEGGFPNHAVVELPDGTQIDPQGCMKVDYNILYRYTFDELFY